jgi:hypothetical protein
MTGPDGKKYPKTFYFKFVDLRKDTIGTVEL